MYNQFNLSERYLKKEWSFWVLPNVTFFNQTYVNESFFSLHTNGSTGNDITSLK